jgi:hypothetical protein
MSSFETAIGMPSGTIIFEQPILGQKGMQSEFFLARQVGLPP